MRMMLSSLMFLFLSAWSSAGIVWSINDHDCNSELTNSCTVIAILSLSLTILIILSCVYWKLMSRPEAEKSRQNQKRDTDRDHSIFMLEEI